LLSGPVFPALGGREDHEFKAILDFIVHCEDPVLRGRREGRKVRRREGGGGRKTGFLKYFFCHY
jgi:hypothetical protein